jgi:hypothetical protein
MKAQAPVVLREKQGVAISRSPETLDNPVNGALNARPLGLRDSASAQNTV